VLLVRQHESFCGLLEDLDCAVTVAPAADGLVDATYVRDPGLMTGRGAILFQQAKPARAAEPALLGQALAAAGVPVIAELTGPARADGGDFSWLDEHTLIAGHSHSERTVPHSPSSLPCSPGNRSRCGQLTCRMTGARTTSCT
jgi:N-dimethylarginine dimethylaminohydrolase